MNSPTAHPTTSDTIEGIARVVSVDGVLAWLEPEQRSGCGSCDARAACSGQGAAGLGSLASRLGARRFTLDRGTGQSELYTGERIVIGVNNGALLKASLTAYALPLLTALGAGGMAQAAYASDLITLLGMAFGLGLGLLAARLVARALAARGDLALRFVRRARPGETCATDWD